MSNTKKRGRGRPAAAKMEIPPIPSDEIVAKMVEGDKELSERPTATLIAQLEKDPWTGLTERQKTVQEMKLRGVSQVSIARFLGISQPLVWHELKAIREIHARRGVTVDTNAIAGETLSLYEELFTKALKTFYEIKNDNPLASQSKLQAINVMATLQDKKIKLLMDLGIIQKASTKIEHEHSLVNKGPTFVDLWQKRDKQVLASNIIESTFTPLAEPEPPKEEIIDVEEMEDDDE